MLAVAIVKEGTKAVAAGMNPMDLKRGIDLAVEAIVEDLRKHSKKFTSNEEVAQVGSEPPGTEPPTPLSVQFAGKPPTWEQQDSMHRRFRISNP